MKCFIDSARMRHRKLVFEFSYKTETKFTSVGDVKALGAGLLSDRMSGPLSDNEDEWNGHVLGSSPTEL